jgi:hypothetical protein
MAGKMSTSWIVIPAKAGIQHFQHLLDPDSRFTTCRDRFRRDDVFRRTLVLFLILVFTLIPSLSFSSTYEPKGPLELKNLNPIYLQFANISPTRAVTIPKGRASFSFVNGYANIFEQGFGANTSELIDMELLRSEFKLAAGIYDGMEAGIEVPFEYGWEGFLDSFIQKYHNFFGFPNGGRETVPNDEYHYYFRQGTQYVYDFGRLHYQLGDITLHFKHNFLDETTARPAVAWLAYLKVPSGNQYRGLGSGSPDIGFGAVLEKSYKRLHGYLNVGYFLNGGHEYLQQYMHDYYFSYVTGLELSVSRPVSILAQISGGTPLMDGTGMTQCDSFPMDLQIGAKGRHALGNGVKYLKTPVFSWQAGFAEDINPNGASVDITFLAGVGVDFGL